MTLKVPPTETRAPELVLVQVINGFREGSRLDWLHPSHGRFPDFVGVYRDTETNEEFEVLVWDLGDDWISAAQGPDTYHSGYPRSFRWKLGEEMVTSCAPSRGEVFEVQLRKGEQQSVLKQIACASVHVLIATEPRFAG